MAKKTNLFSPLCQEDAQMQPRFEIQFWRYIGADPIGDEANDYSKDQSWPTIMQLNKALDILDKKEEALEEHCYP